MNDAETGKLRYVLEEFETEPLPVHVVYPQTKLVTSKVRAFVDECVSKAARHVVRVTKAN